MDSYYPLDSHMVRSEYIWEWKKGHLRYLATTKLWPVSSQKTFYDEKYFASIFLFKSLWPIWISIENGSANSVDYLPRLASIGSQCILGDGDVRPADGLVGRHSLTA